MATVEPWPTRRRHGGAAGPTAPLHVYLGAAAGAGTTVAMLEEGRRLRSGGTDVVVGFVETHGRPHTAALIGDLEVVPRRLVAPAGAIFEEMDRGAVLERHPHVALVDELAHPNAPGTGGNEMRWQDVGELLEAGIAVSTTVSVQHLESVAEAVEHMTGARVEGRVPDWVVRRADRIELIDSSPEQLRRRLVQGSIYPPEHIQDALRHVFRTENLAALRELALRFVAGESADSLLAYLGDRTSAG